MNKPSSGHGKGTFKPKPPGPPTCYGCGEKGHIRSHCPKELKVGTAAAVACGASSDAELPACAAVGSSVQQDFLLLSSDAGQQALLHMASSAAAPAEFPQTAMFTSAASLPVHANSFAALAEVRNAELSADASMLSEPSPDSWQDLKERYYALIADLTPEWRDAIFGPGRNSHDPYVGEEGSISAQSNMVTAVGTVDVQSNKVTAVAAANAQSNMVTAVGAVDAQSNKVTAVAAATATTGVGSRSEDLAALDALIANVSASDAPASADDGKASESSSG